MSGFVVADTRVTQRYDELQIMTQAEEFLSRIRLSRRFQIDELKATLPLTQLMKNMPPQESFRFRAALEKPGIRIIAELKRASPSKGILRPNFDVALLSREYADGGAAALSVLTEPSYFLGKPEYVALARKQSGLPVLCKDFIIDAYQIYHARVMQADAVLLICRILTDEQLTHWITLATELGMDALVETHTENECERSLLAGATIIGVNARDLGSFEVDLNITKRLRAMIPPSVIAIAESGIRSRSDIDALTTIRYRHFLVGEALVTQESPADLLKELIRP